MRDNRASITIEIAVILIIIILIMGIVLRAGENATDKIVEVQEDENTETLLVEIVDNLINNPGTPDNWYENSKGSSGLAIVNEDGQVIPNSVSFEKFCALGDDYDKLIYEKLFGSKIKSSMEMIPQKSTISSVKIGSDDQSNTIYTVNRLVKCDFYKKYVLKDFQNEGKCNRNHDQKSYSCNYFKIFMGNLRDSNYYLLVDDSEKYDLKYSLETTSEYDGISWKSTVSNKIHLNDEIYFGNETSAVVFVHLDKPNPKAVLVSVPKSFDENKLTYDYFRTNECQFVFRAWF